MLTVPRSGISPGVTFVHVAPSSRETWTRPSSDPAHRTPCSSGETSNAKIVPYTSTPVLSFVIGPPAYACFVSSSRVRSGLIVSQLCPPFVERCTYCDA